jgi:hypothetical protein
MCLPVAFRVLDASAASSRRAGVREFYELLPMFRQIVEVNAGELVNIFVKVIQSVVIKVLQFIELHMVFLFFRLTFFWELLQCGSCLFVFLL